MSPFIRIIEERCTGCGKCLEVCPVNCISLEKEKGVIDLPRCIYCGECVGACGEFNAIEMSVEKAKGPDISSYKGVWCCADYVHGKLSPTIYELLHVGRKLASDLNEPLSAVLIGKGVSPEARDLIEHGADTVYVLDDPGFENFLDETYSKALADIISKEKPNKFILAASTMGRSISARLAILLNTGLTADATELVIDKEKGQLMVTRPTFGGNLMATIICENKRPEMCTLRPLTYPKAQKTPGRKGRVIEFKIDPEKCGPGSAKAKFVSFVPEEAGEQDVSVAEVVASGGRGLGKPEGFKLIHELARAFDGAVGSSRAAVDAGWIPYRHQVGLTGKTVKPKIYIACGISGQVQHMTGMSSSDVVIAINRDPECPMMQTATYSIEGDLFEIVPALMEEMKRRKE